ncbi:hypothetical protein [Brachybacterium fresconis]|uniref:Transposase n=1 Tax=Brachybacterium fresconis TaxID=173363 RepID=A0ABS4YK91_9MICO|nr:hypothetical protein [Brachybacterium fresconis]MBP2409169.1 hypothetical protein [Brachybacterium fresconis]
MGEQIPLGRFIGLAGLPWEQIQQLLDHVDGPWAIGARRRCAQRRFQ